MWLFILILITRAAIKAVAIMLVSLAVGHPDDSE